MAIYVTSDAHGHVRPLDRLLSRVSLADDDTLYVLGDMIDRGPEPVEVIRLVRRVPGARVLMGNHERMMLDALLNHDDIDDITWAFNGGAATLAGLDGMPEDEFAETVAWVRDLPLFDVVEAGARLWILVHAGIDALAARGFLATAGVDCSEGKGARAAGRDMLLDMMSRQDPLDLLWIREGFWGEPTGLVGADGSGPIVVAGHTPSIMLAHYVDVMEGDGTSPEGVGTIVRVGATEKTAGMPDRFDIDCSAAAGYGRGCVGLMRLDDQAMWFEPVGEGE